MIGADGGVAQLGEHLPCTQGVIGSNPFTSTNAAITREQLVEDRECRWNPMGPKGFRGTGGEIFDNFI